MKTQNERAGIPAGIPEHPELIERDSLETEVFLTLESESPDILRELRQTSTGLQRLALLDRWQALGRPRPTFLLLCRPEEESMPEFERFLDSYRNGDSILSRS
jgi:hypothetical protein